MDGKKAVFRLDFQYRPRVYGGGPDGLGSEPASALASSPCVRGWTKVGEIEVQSGKHRPRVYGGGPDIAKVLWALG